MNNKYYLGLFEPLRIENPELYVDYIFQGAPDATAKEKQQYLDFLNSVTGELNDAEKRKIIAHFTSNKNQNVALMNMENMVNEIKMLNPVLRDIPVNNHTNAYDLLIGVTSRFHPKDIKYFITQCNKGLGWWNKIHQDQKLFYTVLDYAPNLFMAPSRIETCIPNKHLPFVGIVLFLSAYAKATVDTTSQQLLRPCGLPHEASQTRSVVGVCGRNAS